jgi:ubiquinone/menaquinone biosynthesis C-methylase UbiE
MARDERTQRFDALRVGPETIRDFFDRVGPRFYTWYFALMGYRSSLGHFWREHFARMGLREETRILDSGIGTGFLTVSLLRESPIPLTITGVRFSTRIT